MNTLSNAPTPGREQIDHALSQLTPRERELFLLHYDERMSIEAIAAKTGQSSCATRQVQLRTLTRIQRALAARVGS